MSSGRVANQYLVGSVSSSGHSISSHSSARGSLSKLSRCADRTRWRAKRDASQSALPSRQAIVCHTSVRQAQGKRLDGDGLVRLVALQPRLGPSARRSGLRQQRGHPRWITRTYKSFSCRAGGSISSTYFQSRVDSLVSFLALSMHVDGCAVRSAMAAVPGWPGPGRDPHPRSSALVGTRKIFPETREAPGN